MSIGKSLKGSLKGTPSEQVAVLRKNKHAFDAYLTPEEREIVHKDTEVIADVLKIYISDE